MGDPEELSSAKRPRSAVEEEEAQVASGKTDPFDAKAYEY